MCGIVGYIGQGNEAQHVLLDGLKRLEYRGYDSSGVAIVDGGRMTLRRSLGKLVNLEASLREEPIAGHAGKAY